MKCARIQYTANGMYSPMSGTVAAVNTALEDNPALINEDPYGEGWILKLTVSNAGEYDVLLDSSAYQASIEESEG